MQKETKIHDVTFQYFRHYFISHCVMAGVDFMTIAKWVGHLDGGVLIGKLYGHLSRAPPGDGEEAGCEVLGADRL